MNACSTIFFALAAMSCCCTTVSADEAATTDYGALVKQLDADSFAKRQQASEKLTAAGSHALPALKRAALSESREASSRAIDILKRHFETGNDELKSAAKEVLEQISNSDKTRAARAAKGILEPPPARPPANNGRIQIGGGQIQIQIIGQAANGRRISIKTVNGVKQIEAEENGEKVKIVDDPAKGIKMEITKKKDGKNVTEKFEAKNADELKKKHPDAHKLYEKYSKNQGGIRIQGIQIQPGGRIQGIPIPIRPQQIRPFRIRNDRQIKEAADRLKKAVKEIENTVEQLKEKTGDDIKQVIERLEKVKKQLEETKAGLER